MTKEQVESIRIKAYCDGRVLEAEYWEELATPAFLVEEFIDRFHIVPSRQISALVVK